MKPLRSLSAAGALVFTLALASHANVASADGHSEGFYIGADYSRLKVGLDSPDLKNALDANYSGFGLHLGKRFNHRFSAEASYLSANGGGQTLTAPAGEPIRLRIFDQTLIVPPGVSAKIQEEKVSAFALDGFTHFPLGKSRLEGIAGLGLAYGKYEITAIETTTNTTFRFNKSAPLLRFTLGTQLQLHQRSQLRALLRYYPTFNQISSINNVRELSLGINILF